MTGTQMLNRTTTALFCLLIVAGCKDTTGPDQRTADADNSAKAELVDLRLRLAKLKADNEQLKTNIDELFQELEDTKSQLETTLRNQGRVQADAVKSFTRQAQQDVVQLGAERDAAFAQSSQAQALIEQLRQQLKQKDLRIQQLEDLAEQMQSRIENTELEVETWDVDPNTEVQEMPDGDYVR